MSKLFTYPIALLVLFLGKLTLILFGSIPNIREDENPPKPETVLKLKPNSDVWETRKEKPKTKEETPEFFTRRSRLTTPKREEPYMPFPKNLFCF